MISIVFSACASRGSFSEIDADQDQVVTVEEAAQDRQLSDLFTSADDDKDGVLDREEFELARKVIEGSRRSEKRRSMMTEKGGIKRLQ